MIERVEHVVRQTGQQVDDEPRAQVVHADDLGVGHDLAAGPDERGVKIEHDVDEKYHVHDGVDHQQRHVLARLVLERHVVRHHDGRVEGQAQDHPVPDGFERAVMQQYVRRRLRRLLPVLGHYVGVQAHHLHKAKVHGDSSTPGLVRTVFISEPPLYPPLPATRYLPIPTPPRQIFLRAVTDMCVAMKSV